MNLTAKNRLKRTAILCAFGLALGLGIGWMQVRARGGAVLRETSAAMPGVQVGGDFSLTDHNGRPVTQKDFPGPKLVFFGFASCPDVCPAALRKMARVLDALGAEGARIRPLFITVDPAHDTPPVLKDYVAQFHPRLTGLTGTREQTRAAAETYRAYASKAEGSGMNHSSFIYLMSPGNAPLAVYAPEESAEDMARDIRARLAQGPRA